MGNSIVTSIPSKKILHWANVFVEHEAHAIAQPCRHTNSEAFPALKGYAICTYRIKFRMLEVRENETSLRKLSGGTAQLRSCAP